MRVLLFLLQKEFRQIFRNRIIVVTIMVLPMVQLLILPQAADYEVKNINLAVVDHDHSAFARQMTDRITASGYFRLQWYGASYEEAFRLIESDKADLILEIPAGFERNLIREDRQQVRVAVNAINGTKAGLGGAYLTQVLQRFNQDTRMEWTVGDGQTGASRIELTVSNWFNPSMNYRYYMVPGILAILVSMVGGFLAALNIVKEKEVGTIEQINVTPIRKHIFIAGKVIPFWILGNVVFTIGLIVAWLVYGIVPAGQLWVLYGFIWIYLLAVLGLGLLISTYSDTQQQAMLIIFFFIMIFILLSGLFTPVKSMPEWAQMIVWFNPLSYLIEVVRMVVLKGSGWADIQPQVIRICAFAVVLNAWAIWNYRKRS